MRRFVVVGAVAVGMLVSGCAGSQSSSQPETSSAAASPVQQVGNPDDPCTLLTAEDINATLGTSFEASQAVEDPAREIVTCKYTSPDGTQIVDVGVSQTPGAKAFTTNRDLAPAYFGGNAKAVDIPGADKAYLVIAETYDAPVIGMQVGSIFALVQVGVEGTTPEQGEQLAAIAAGRL